MITEELTKLRISTAVMEARMEARWDALEKATERLEKKIDSLTWKLALCVVSVIASQIIIEMILR